MKRFMVVLSVVLLSVPIMADYTYEITAGYFGDLTLNGDQTLLMTGGGGDSLTGLNNSILYIQGSTSPVIRGVSGIYDLILGDNSQLYFSGGSLHLLDSFSNSTIVLSGGQIEKIRGYYFFPPNPDRIKLICDEYSLTYTSGLVTKINGTWCDGSLFNIQLVNLSGYSPIFDNMTIIPEPATMLLLGLGGLLLKRR